MLPNQQTLLPAKSTLKAKYLSDKAQNHSINFTLILGESLLFWTHYSNKIIQPISSLSPPMGNWLAG